MKHSQHHNRKEEFRMKNYFRLNNVRKSIAAFTATLLIPTIALADANAYVNNIVHTATTVGKWVSLLFFASLAIMFSIRWWSYSHAGDDSDMKTSKKQIRWTLIGAVGFGAVAVIIQLIQSIHG